MGLVMDLQPHDQGPEPVYALAIDPDRNPAWPISRQHFMLETSLPGVFAVGVARADYAVA